MRRPLGILVSLGLHAALLAWMIQPTPKPAPERVSLRLLSPPPATPTSTEPATPTPVAEAERPRTAPRRAPDQRPPAPQLEAPPPAVQPQTPRTIELDPREARARGRALVMGAAEEPGLEVGSPGSGVQSVPGVGPVAASGAEGPTRGVGIGPPGPAILPPAPVESRPQVLLRPKAGGGYVYQDRGFVAEIGHDGAVRFEDHLPIHLGGESTSGVGLLTFDLTEAVMMIAKDDPYRVDKERFLAATAGLRAELCAADHQERLQQSLLALNGELDRLWNDQGRGERNRRAVLFQLWDECLDPAPETTDASERTALQARATILAYVKKNLPLGSPAAYPVDELLALNAHRRSRLPFDPYAGEADAGVQCD